MYPKETVSLKLPNGMRVVADVSGPAGGQPVLLLHGGGQTRQSWKDSGLVLAELGYRAYTVDARGHGESDRSADGNYTPDGFADDLSAIVRHVGGKPVLIGASLGGIVSLLIAGEQPSTVRALVLVDVAVRTNPYGVARTQAFMRGNPDGFETVDAAADAVAQFATDRPRPRDVNGLRRNLRLVDGRYYWHWDPRFMESWPPAYDAARGRLERAAHHITAPLLIVHAAQSDVLGEKEVDHLRTLAPHAEYARVEGAGHMVVGDRNSAFNNAIFTFLAKSAPPL